MSRTRIQEKRLGDHLVTCDLSGWVCWASDSRKTWDGLTVFKDFWEPRHPQDFVRGVHEDNTVPNSSPEPADVFISDQYPNGVTSSDL